MSILPNNKHKRFQQVRDPDKPRRVYKIGRWKPCHSQAAVMYADDVPYREMAKILGKSYVTICNWACAPRMAEKVAYFREKTEEALLQSSIDKTISVVEILKNEEQYVAHELIRTIKDDTLTDANRLKAIKLFFEATGHLKGETGSAAATVVVGEDFLRKFEILQGKEKTNERPIEEISDGTSRLVPEGMRKTGDRPLGLGREFPRGESTGG